MDRTTKNRDDKSDLWALIDVTRGLPGFSLVGFDTSSQPATADVASLPIDARSPAAGLFGLRGPRSWTAVGVTVEGSAVRIDSDDERVPVTAGMVITRDGEIGSFVSPRTSEYPDDDPTAEQAELETTARIYDPDQKFRGTGYSEDAAAEGLFVDALHRVLGLPSPGAPPDPADMIMCLWMDDILAVLDVDERIDWPTIARMNPAVESMATHRPTVPPSDETILEAIGRSRSHIDWNRVHRRAVRSDHWTGGLAPDEVRWMDTTMFARWSLSLLPDVALVRKVLIDRGCVYEAERLSSLAEQLRFDDPPLPGAA